MSLLMLILSLILCVTAINIFKHNLIDNKKSDAYLQLNAASKFGNWLLPSQMHKYSNGKSYMKDMGLILIVFAIKVLKFPLRFSTIVSVCTICHFLSALLIFLISQSLFNTKMALVSFIFYISCGWAYQVVLIGGYQIVAQLVFLTSFYFSLFLPSFFGYNFSSLVSGIFFGALIFSSASARKYYILALASYLFSFTFYFQIDFLEYLKEITFEGNTLSITIILFSITIFQLSLYFSKKLVVYMYQSKMTVPIINRTFHSKFGLKYYLDIHKALSGALCQFFYLFLPLITLTLLKTDPRLIASVLYYFLGITLSVSFFSYPDFFKILREGFGYLSNADAGHFVLYREYLEKVDGKITTGWRARQSGLLWVYKISFQYVPFQTILFVSLSFYLIIFSTSKSQVILIVFFAISPHLWGELTKGPQIGRSYFPGYTGMLLGIMSLYSLMPNNVQQKAFTVLLVISLLSLGHGIKITVSDIYKTKMWVLNLKKCLLNLGIKKFSTYKTAYNHSFVDVLIHEFPNLFEVEYVDKMENSKHRFFVVPCTSSKAAHMESEREAISFGDFNRDIALERLLNSRKIEGLSLAKIPTLGNSHFWIHESEVTSYRYLMLREYDSAHYFRSYAWILDLNKAKDSQLL